MNETEQEMIQATGYIYKIINLKNGKIYIGITKCSIQKRWNEHKHNALRNKKHSHLSLAMRKYGVENFAIQKLKTCFSDSQLYNGEIYFIQLYQSSFRLKGYNNSVGCEASSKGKTLSDELKKKISIFQRQRVRPRHSEETKIKMRKISVGRDMHKAVAASVNKRKGIKLAESHRQNIAAACVDIGNIPVLKIINDVAVEEYKSVSIAAKSNGILQSSISNVLTNRSKTAGGFKWAYKQMNLE